MIMVLFKHTGFWFFFLGFLSSGGTTRGSSSATSTSGGWSSTTTRANIGQHVLDILALKSLVWISLRSLNDLFECADLGEERGPDTFDIRDTCSLDNGVDLVGLYKILVSVCFDVAGVVRRFRHHHRPR